MVFKYIKLLDDWYVEPTNSGTYKTEAPYIKHNCNKKHNYIEKESYKCTLCGKVAPNEIQFISTMMSF